LIWFGNAIVVSISLTLVSF